MIEKLKIWLNKHIYSDFSYPDECWNCKVGSCKGCKCERGLI